MYQVASTNHQYTRKQLIGQYRAKINQIANNVLNKQRYGIDAPVDRFAFVKLKSLFPSLCDAVLTADLNQFHTALISK